MEEGRGKKKRKDTRTHRWAGLVLALVCFWAGGLWAGGPQLKVSEPTHDFGEVTEGETVSHEFILQNTGTETLQINDVRPG